VPARGGIPGIEGGWAGFYKANLPDQEVARRVRRMLVVLSLLTALGMLATGCTAVGGGGAPTETEPPTTAPGGYYGAPAQPGQAPGQQPYGQAPGQQPAQPVQPAPQQPPAQFAKVDISNSTYAPGSVNIRVGQKVSWNNEDQVAHTVTADGLTFGKNLPSGAVFNFAFVKPGNFPYHCAIHPAMRGTVVVS
jgi:plastocyanin